MKHRKLIALLAAIVATFAMWQILNTQDKSREAEMDYREVIVAVSEVKMGEVISRNKLTLKKIPKQHTPEDALVEGKDAVGKVAQSGILPGEILTAARVADAEDGQAGLAYKIPEDSRAITLNVDTESGVSGMILPGDDVDLMITLTGAAATEDMGTETAPPAGEVPIEGEVPEETQSVESLNVKTYYLLEKVRVLACGSDLSKEAAGQTAAQTGNMYGSVTLSVSREEALQIEFYTYLARNNNGNIRLTLRPTDKQAESSENDTGE